MGALRSRLKEWRERVGLTQAALAAAAGVQRQTIGSIEAGRHGPGVEVGLRLAAALGCRVEDLFSLSDEQPRIRAAGIPVGAPAGTRVVLAEIGGRVWARPLAGLGGAGLPTLAAHGVTEADGRVRLLPGAGRGVFLAGCDPALGLLAGHVRRSGSDAFWWEAGNGDAAGGLRSGAVHAAVLHGQDDDRPDAPFPLVGFRLAAWEIGWMVACDNPLGIHGAPDLARSGVRLANREEGSGARRLLDARLDAAGVAPREVAGYDRVFSGHVAVAQAIALGAADVGIGVPTAAARYGLTFLPLRAERSILWLPAATVEAGTVARLLDALTGAAFRQDLAAFGPYGTDGTGDQVA